MIRKFAFSKTSNIFRVFWRKQGFHFTSCTFARKTKVSNYKVGVKSWIVSLLLEKSTYNTVIKYFLELEWKYNHKIYTLLRLCLIKVCVRWYSVRGKALADYQGRYKLEVNRAEVSTCDYRARAGWLSCTFSTSHLHYAKTVKLQGVVFRFCLASAKPNFYVAL